MANKVKADDEVFSYRKKNTLVAHYGLINKDDETAELDNSILIKILYQSILWCIQNMQYSRFRLVF